ncbi:MoaD/ThiS family protein [Halolamina sp. CBA1230]|uniref:ubiquitin-like small modifier protein SAMP2 n=1 Tax=Halolamina sp. CBA1230 TaxID=1853690 RepID=UPI0009A1B509|nr:ubiquitin-like small modifier protein 2 [Halolamina sp. CBA1230]QKY20815.1 MoaD/ThiS family protein [Halolamina sp. CBA1230]
MQLTVEIVGEDERTVTVPDDADYADVVREVGYSPHEVTVLVDDSPVPEDAPVETDHVRVLRLIAGG